MCWLERANKATDGGKRCSPSTAPRASRAASARRFGRYKRGPYQIGAGRKKFPRTSWNDHRRKIK